MGIFSFNAVLCAMAIVLLPASATDINFSTQCNTDRDCVPTMFCYNAGCYPCFDCGKVFRQNRLRCSKEPSDCGECLLGYKEDSYKTSHYHWCRLDVTRAEPRKTDNPDDAKFKVSFQSMAIFVIACVFVLGFVSYYCYNSNRHNDSWTANVRANYQFSNPPPSYKEEDIPVRDCGNSRPCSFQLQVTGNSEGDQQKAVPFLYVENLRTETGDTNGTIQIVQTSPTLNSVTETAFTAVNIDIHDETTVPSAWTPGASYGETVSDGKEVESPPKKRKKSCPAEEIDDHKKESQ